MTKDRKSLNDAITFTDMNEALERWFLKGDITRAQYKSAKEGLQLAFHLGCSDYLTKLTDEVCGKEGR